MLGQNGPKSAHLAQRGFFRKFHLGNFFLLTASYHAGKFEKKIGTADPGI